MNAPESPGFTLGVIGAGLMGGGIAQVAAQAGIRTLLFDAQAGAAVKAKQNIAATFQRLAAKGRMSDDAVAKALQQVEPVESLDALADCDTVIEAIVENLEVKRDLFARLEKVVGADCVLATNTSSLSVTAIAAACATPSRVAGFHFFSPVPLMKIVEVIDGARTEPAVGAKLVALATRMGHAPVRARDTPGFIVNHAGRAYGTEALRILGENVAAFHELDRILRDGAGFRMGPFELLDLTGLDVSQPVMDSIYHQYYEEPRFRPSPLLMQRKHAGMLGRKSGEGFYKYMGGAMQPIPSAAPPAARPASVWVSRRYPESHALVAFLVWDLGGKLEDGERPSDEALCVVTPLGGDATSRAVAERLDPRRTIAFDALFGTTTHRTLMATPVTTPAMREAALGLFQADGVPASMIRDSAGMVAQRVVAHIVNVACDIAQQGIATPADIDRAVTLGLGYRQGPLAMGDTIGPGTILAILEALQDFYGDPRYRPSPWLKRRARLGISLLTTDPT
ncbi:MAG: 3-hydroxyacyl-CoA dehydrogenase [Betaproteobacteria bacterium]